VADPETRHHFKIGEVAEMLGVKAHVLRYWEQEFPALRPKKTRGAHRHYSRENLALAREIHALVVESGYSIPGARNKLLGAKRDPVDSRGGDDAIRHDLLAIRAELVALLDYLDGAETPEALAEAERSEEVAVAAPRSRSR